ncbi:MAG: pyridoxamine 5'-phosphate oxidase family protein [Pseudonocardiales bacterium]|nr:pyridoxamine 5'-phosphate oxidase family protein [Pseudonocardiales bacterium]
MDTLAPLSPTPRSSLNRAKDRARRDRSELYAVLDAGLICHLGVLVDGAPMVLPTCYGRAGDTLYLHGSTGAGSLRAGVHNPVCVTVTLLDGLVYARSVFHHSANYRCAVVHGVPEPVTDEAAKLRALRAIVENVTPGSWTHARQPDRKELAATAVLALDLTEASVKVRTGPPVDDEPDVAAREAWAGVLPTRTTFGQPRPCPLLSDAMATPPPHVLTRITPASAHG